MPDYGNTAAFFLKYPFTAGESMSELIKISIPDEALRAALGRLIASLTDTTPTMRDLSEIMIDASARAFDKTADPATGTPWQPLSAARQKQREDKGRSIANMLQDSGLLVGSITNASGRYAVREIGPGYALVGTNVPYAAIHQFGGKTGPRIIRAKKGKALKIPGIGFRRSVNHPGSVIPARPFIGVSPTDIQDMLDAITRNLQKALKP